MISHSIINLLGYHKLLSYQKFCLLLPYLPLYLSRCDCNLYNVRKSYNWMLLDNIL